MKVCVYTDGACSGNPGPGGWGVIFTLPSNYLPISGYQLDTTNNRMELTAVIESLKRLLNGTIKVDGDTVDAVDIHSDSAYVVNAINNQWYLVWSANRWTTSGGKAVKNQDLWIQLIDLLYRAELEGIKVQFIKVKGHSGNTFNEMVDQLAVEASNEAQAEVAASGGM